MSYYNDPGIEKTQEALITHLALINESNKWPEFMFLANDFISKMNTIETLTSY